MTDTADNLTPNDILAAQVAEKLAEAGLIPPNRQSQLLSKLKVGGVDRDDWNQWVDMATAPQKSEGDNNE